MYGPSSSRDTLSEHETRRRLIRQTDRAISKQNIRVDVPITITQYRVTEPEVMQNATERLLD